jgi:hypothetical protein
MCNGACQLVEVKHHFETAPKMVVSLCFSVLLLASLSKAIPARPKHIFAVLVDDLGDNLALLSVTTYERFNSQLYYSTPSKSGLGLYLYTTDGYST